MAAIAPMPTQYDQIASIKDEPTTQVTEVQPESPKEEDISDANEGEYSVMGHKKKPSTKKGTKKGDITIQPFPLPGKGGITIQPYLPITPGHPILLPNGGTTLDNVREHMVCNDLFLRNVRNLVEEYKVLMDENAKQARKISALDREVIELKDQVENITAERDEYHRDYDAELSAHMMTREELYSVRNQLANLRRRYNEALADLKDHKARLNEVRRENSQLKVEIADKKARIEDLEQKLRISNASEDAANERVTKLQRSIYELERTKTRIEKEKDKAEKEVRDRNDTISLLKRKIDALEKTIRDLKRPVRIAINDVEALEESPVLKTHASQVQDPLFEALTKDHEDLSSPPNEE